MALPLASIALFSGVVLTAGAVTAGGIGFTADTVARMAVAKPVKTQAQRISYGTALPMARAEDLDIARSMPVVPSGYVQADPAESQPSAQQVADTAPHLQAATQPSGAVTLENGRWVRIDGAVKGWVLNDAGFWEYASLSEPAAR